MFFSNLQAVIRSWGLSGANDASSTLSRPDGLPRVHPDPTLDERARRFNGTDADEPAFLELSDAPHQRASVGVETDRWHVDSRDV